jgi:chromosome segregation ATPase
LAWRQEISTGIDNLGSQIHELSISQDNLLNKQNLVATQIQSTDNDIRHVSDEITTLGINFESQTTQILALRRDITNRHKDLTAEVQTGSLLTRQGLDALSRKSDLILHTISKTHMDGGSGKQLIRLNDQDEVLLLLFQL